MLRNNVWGEGGRKNVLLAGVQIRAVSLLPLYSLLFSENFLSPLTSGVCLQLAEARAMGQPVFRLDVRREHTANREVT